MWNSGKRPFRQRVVAVAFGVLLGTVTASAEAAEVAGELISASGPVDVRPLGGGVWRAATLRTVLHSGDMVRTGVGGAAEVALVHGVFRMAENTVIILPPPRAVPAAAGDAPGIRLLLYRGRALFHILKDRLEGSFDVITPSVIVGVKGTTFGIEEGATAGVVVFDGSVQAVPTGRPATPPLIVGAGQFTVLVQGELTPPQLYQPGAPGAMWGGGPTRTEGAPLVSPPVGPAATGGEGTTEELKTGAGAAAAALAQVGGAPLLSALALHTLAPPRLAAAGGPPGSTGVSPTTHLGGRALSRAASGGRDDDRDDRGRGGGGEGRGRGRDHGRGRCRGRGC